MKLPENLDLFFKGFSSKLRVDLERLIDKPLVESSTGSPGDGFRVSIRMERKPANSRDGILISSASCHNPGSIEGACLVKNKDPANW